MTRTPWMVLPSARPMVAETMTIQLTELTGHVSRERVIHLQHIQREVPEAEERGVADDRVIIRLQNCRTEGLSTTRAGEVAHGQNR